MVLSFSLSNKSRPKADKAAIIAHFDELGRRSCQNGSQHAVGKEFVSCRELSNMSHEIQKWTQRALIR